MVGGKDEVYIKQHSSSQLSELEFRNYVKEIGNDRFSGVESKSNEPPINYSEKVSQFLVLPFYINTPSLPVKKAYNFVLKSNGVRSEQIYTSSDP
jgi:hypothetical protein